MGTIPRILVTMGEPAGIGPELLVRIAQSSFDAQIVVLTNDSLLKRVASDLNVEIFLSPINWNEPPVSNIKGQLFFEQVNLNSQVVTGCLDVGNSSAVLAMLSRAGELALAKVVDGIVTAPVHKAILNKVEPSFLGHTEFFALQAKVDRVVMLLATHQLRIALATTHIPLSEVSQTIDSLLLDQVIKVIDRSFSQFGLGAPEIAVCGVNPHAGEDGLLGSEDRDVVGPAIAQLRKEGINASGPFPADSLFTKSNRSQYDVFLAMYHDQGLPVVKAIGFGECANITLGLPYIRTSVDHGTAIDIAKKMTASSSSLEYAINYAIQLAKGNLPQ